MRNISIFAVIIALFLVLGCDGGSTYRISVEIVQPIDVNPFDKVSSLEIDIINAEDQTEKQTKEFKNNGSFDNLNINYSGLDYYEEFFFMIKGKNAGGKIISRGRTQMHNARLLDGGSFSVYLAPLNEFSMPPTQLDQPLSGAKLIVPNEYQMLIVGGAARDKNGDVGDTTTKIGSFSPPNYTLETMKSGDQTVYLGAGMVGHTINMLDANSFLISGGYAKTAENIEWIEVPYIVTIGDETTIAKAEINEAFTPRTKHQSSLIRQHKRVLTCGGISEEQKTLKNCMSYDIDNKSVSYAFDLSTERAEHTQTVILSDDNKYVGTLFYGGTDNANLVAEWIENDSVSPGMFSEAPFETRINHQSLLLHNSRALILGGIVNGKVSNTAVIYKAHCAIDKKCKPFAELGAVLTTARHSFTLTPISARYVLACGGIDADGNILDTCEVLETREDDLLANLTTVYMNEARTDHDAMYMPDGTIMVVGGYNDTKGALSSIEVFTTDAD